MNVRIFWVRAMKCMCAQTRPRFILSSERVLGGMEFEPMLTPREKSPLPKNFPRGGSNPRRCGQRSQTLPTSYSSPCHRTLDWGRLQPAEYCFAVWLPVCSSVSYKWPHWLSHSAATQKPAYSVRQQQSSAPVGASTCWHCWKRDCRQAGKGSSKTPSTSLLHLIQRSQDPSETEAEISLEIKKQWIWPTERPG